jgi:O-antigen/teichoic acid export membrane protein
LKNLLYQGLLWRGLNYITLFLVTIAIARLFKAGDSGALNYLINNLALLILITSFSLESATGYFSAKGAISQPVLAGTSIVMALVALATSALLLKLFIPLHDNLTWLVSALYCGGIVLINYFSALFYSHYDYLLPNVLVGITNCGIILLTVVMPAKLLADNGKLFIAIYFSSFLFTGIVLAAAYVYQYAKFLTLPAFPSLRIMFNYAALAVITNVIGFLMYRVDYWFVHRNCSLDELGNYIQVSKLGQIFMLIPVIIAGTVFTRTAKSSPSSALTDLQTVSRLMWLLYMGIMLLIILFGYWLFPFVYGRSFLLMYVPFLLLVPGIFSLVTVALVTAYNAGRGKVMVNLKGSLLALIIIVSGNFLFSRSYGIYAAAAVSSLGYISYLAYIMFIIKRENSDTKVLEFFRPTRADFRRVRQLFNIQSH